MPPSNRSNTTSDFQFFKDEPIDDVQCVEWADYHIPDNEPTVVDLMLRDRPVRQKNLSAVDGKFEVPDELSYLKEVSTIRASFPGLKLTAFSWTRRRLNVCSSTLKGSSYRCSMRSRKKSSQRLRMSKITCKSSNKYIAWP